MTTIPGAKDLVDDFASVWDAEDMACDVLGIRRQAACVALAAPNGDRVELASGVPGLVLTSPLPLVDGRTLPVGARVAVIQYPFGEARVLAAG